MKTYREIKKSFLKEADEPAKDSADDKVAEPAVKSSTYKKDIENKMTSSFVSFAEDLVSWMEHATAVGEIPMDDPEYAQHKIKTTIDHVLKSAVFQAQPLRDLVKYTDKLDWDKKLILQKAFLRIGDPMVKFINQVIDYKVNEGKKLAKEAKKATKVKVKEQIANVTGPAVATDVPFKPKKKK